MFELAGTENADITSAFVLTNLNKATRQERNFCTEVKIVLYIINNLGISTGGLAYFWWWRNAAVTGSHVGIG
jgi:hypothetical protein